MNLVEPIKDLNKIIQIKNILSDKPRNLLLFRLGIESALRISDILKLNVSDVYNKKEIVVKEKKTSKRKSFPISPDLREFINNYVESRNLELNEPLFLTQKNKRMDRIQAWKIIKNACKQAGVRANVGTHTLRKTFGYHHYNQYHDLAILQKILNHSSPAITLRYIGIEQEQVNESYAGLVLCNMDKPQEVKEPKKDVVKDCLEMIDNYLQNNGYRQNGFIAMLQDSLRLAV
jgi:integrase